MLDVLHAARRFVFRFCFCFCRTVDVVVFIWIGGCCRCCRCVEPGRTMLAAVSSSVVGAIKAIAIGVAGCCETVAFTGL